MHSDIKKIIGLFLIWKAFLIICLFFALNFIPLAQTDRYLGGGLSNYLTNPYLFSWANFDGEHYLSIAIFGYKGLEQAFFPVYPILIHFFSRPDIFNLNTSLFSAVSWGLIISNLTFAGSLILLFKLIKFDYPSKIAWLTLILLLVFPTSFYFGALYSESIFLLISLGSFYFARKGNFFLASLLGILSSATRVFGVLLLPAFFLEARIQKVPFKKYFWILFIPAGLLAYMTYQWWLVGDPLAFYNVQTNVGEHRTSGITLLPQIYFRYLKILLTYDITSPLYQTILLEFIAGISFLLLPIYGYFKKVRFSYLAYSLLGFLMTTIHGSFSSVPRYVLVFFPSFLCMALFLVNQNKLTKWIIISIFIIWLAIESMLFLRGYWVA